MPGQIDLGNKADSVSISSSFFSWAGEVSASRGSWSVIGSSYMSMSLLYLAMRPPFQCLAAYQFRLIFGINDFQVCVVTVPLVAVLKRHEPVSPIYVGRLTMEPKNGLNPRLAHHLPVH